MIEIVIIVQCHPPSLLPDVVVPSVLKPSLKVRCHNSITDFFKLHLKP